MRTHIVDNCQRYISVLACSCFAMLPTTRCSLSLASTHTLYPWQAPVRFIIGQAAALTITPGPDLTHTPNIAMGLGLFKWKISIWILFGFLVLPWLFWGSGVGWKWSWAIGLRPVLVWGSLLKLTPSLPPARCWWVASYSSCSILPGSGGSGAVCSFEL